MWDHGAIIAMHYPSQWYTLEFKLIILLLRIVKYQVTEFLQKSITGILWKYLQIFYLISLHLSTKTCLQKWRCRWVIIKCISQSVVRCVLGEFPITYGVMRSVQIVTEFNLEFNWLQIFLLGDNNQSALSLEINIPMTWADRSRIYISLCFDRSIAVENNWTHYWIQQVCVLSYRTFNFVPLYTLTKAKVLSLHFCMVNYVDVVKWCLFDGDISR